MWIEDEYDNCTMCSNLEEWFSYEHVERISYLYLVPLVCIPGIVAAVLSSIVFFRLRHSSLEVLLCGLSLFDVFLLICSIMIYPSMHKCTEFQTMDERHNSITCHFFWRGTVSIFPLSLIAQAGSVWTYVAVTVDRFIAVSFPLKKRVWSTKSNALKVLIGITFVSTIFKLPSFFEVKLDQNGEVVPTELRINKFYIEFYLFYLYAAFIQIIPWTIIIFLNSIIIHRVRKAYRVQEAMIHNRAKPKTKREDAERNCVLMIVRNSLVITVMATVMTMIFIFCNIPPGINYLVDRYAPTSAYRQRIPLSNLLVCVNSASNMMIYCVFNKRFRREAWKLLGCIASKNRNGSVVTRLTKMDETTGMLRSRVTTCENLNSRYPEEVTVC